jgi:regulator of sigma E protease
MNILKIIEVIIGFGFMIFIHEGGHYLACRLFGIAVDEFALGFGPMLTSRKWGNTLYSIRAIPLGGFCKPKGGDLSAQSAEEMYAKPAEPGDFIYASWWKRIVVFLAGPSMNFLSAIAIVAFIFIFVGKPVSDIKPILGYVSPGSLAEKAGLKQGDLIVKMDGKEVTNFDDLVKYFPGYGKTAAVVSQRNGKPFETKVERPPKPADSPGSEPEWGIIDVAPAVVGEALMGQPARNAGIRDGDEIIGINGKKPADWGEVSYLIRHTEKDPLEFEILRDGKLHRVSINRVFNGEYKAIGISRQMDKQIATQKTPFFQAFAEATVFTVDRCGLMIVGIGRLVSGRISLMDNVAGPITIMRMMYDRSQKLEDFLLLVSMISLMLFIMNLLPIPVVDGGQIVLCFVEGLIRKPVSVKAQMIYQQVGFYLIIGLMGLAVYNDIKNIVLEILNRIH